MNSSIQKVLVTGGAGYVGAVLVPKLLAMGYAVRVLDLYLFGRTVFAGLTEDPNLEEHVGDIRDESTVAAAVAGCDAVIHLACISNDPSFELNPALGRSINFDAFEPLVRIAKASGVRRFIFASTSSVYGSSEAPEVDEATELRPLTDYSKFKALCEPILHAYESSDFSTIVVRPATVCGYSPRQRLDLVVNILTNHAVNRGRITVFGGSQTRPNIHIADMADLYAFLLSRDNTNVSGETYNAGFENHTVSDLALLVKRVVAEELPNHEVIDIVTNPSDDNRSYRINSEKLRSHLGWSTKRTIEDAVKDLVLAFRDRKLLDPMNDPKYFNIKTMQQAKLV